MEKMDLFRITQAHGYIFQIFFAEVLCTRYLPKKKNFLLRALTSGMIFLLAFCCAAEYNQQLCFRSIFLYRILSQSWLLALLPGSRFPGNIV